MQPQSFNTKNNNKSALGKFVKPLAFVLVIGAAYVAGIFTPQLMADQKYAPAEETAKSFISNVTDGEYQAAVDRGTEDFQTEFDDPNLLKVALGDVETDNLEVKDTSETRVDDFYQYRQLVDGLPANDAGLTDGLFEVSLVNQDDTWQVASVNLL
ncbi:MAG: hypothetical protein U5L95_03030 [Candidatus Saccharibacteria bacterium]|nr:hypothetical protein [Candidatus Saccharibacteria bacterium]